MRHETLHHTVRLTMAAAALCGLAACARSSTPTPTATPAGAGTGAIGSDTPNTRARSGLQSVTFTDADRIRFNSVAQMIQARFSGVQVSRTGGGYSIKINGAESFQSGSEPLVIVDGATMSGTAALDGVNVRDVTKIEVLKNAAASIYGVRGGNGVIVVSTQRVPQ